MLFNSLLRIKLKADFVDKGVFCSTHKLRIKSFLVLLNQIIHPLKTIRKWLFSSSEYANVVFV